MFGAKWGEFEMTWIDNPLTVALTKVHDAFSTLMGVALIREYVKKPTKKYVKKLEFERK